MKKQSGWNLVIVANRLFFITILGLYCSLPVTGQTEKLVIDHKKQHKNIIRYDLTGALLFGPSNYVVFGYERVLKNHQSISINAGRVALPKLYSFTSDSFYLKRAAKNNGFNVSADYRFYLKKENTRNAPRGVYVGPYYSYNQFKKNNEWSFKEGEPDQQLVNTALALNIHTIGAEFGYQFVFWDKLALDMIIIGPGVSNYYIKAKADGNLSEENKEKLQEGLQRFINDKFPGLNYAIDANELKAKGVLNTWSFGYRFIIHVGFSF